MARPPRARHSGSLARALEMATAALSRKRPVTQPGRIVTA